MHQVYCVIDVMLLSIQLKVNFADNCNRKMFFSSSFGNIWQNTNILSVILLYLLIWDSQKYIGCNCCSKKHPYMFMLPIKVTTAPSAVQWRKPITHFFVNFFFNVSVCRSPVSVAKTNHTQLWGAITHAGMFKTNPLYFLRLYYWFIPQMSKTVFLCYLFPWINFAKLKCKCLHLFFLHSRVKWRTVWRRPSMFCAAML